MRQYNIFQALYMSFYSKDLYRDVATRWGARAFLYLFFILALSWIVFVIQVQQNLNVNYAMYGDKLAAQFPVMTFKNGKLTTPEQRPYVIKDINSGNRLIMIDATGHYKTLDQSQTAILLTQTELINKKENGEITITPISPTLNIVIDPVVVNGYLKNYLPFAWMFIFPLLLIAAYLFRLIQALFYGLIGKVIADIQHVPLTYGKIVEIMMVAITPPLFLATLLDAFSLSFRFEYILFFILAMSYLSFGILANKMKS